MAGQNDDAAITLAAGAHAVKHDGAAVTLVDSSVPITDADIGDKAFSNPPATLTTTEKGAVRSAIGAGTSSFDGTWNSLAGRPTIPTDTTIFKGAWATGTAYAIGDLVTRNNNVYLCTVANSDTAFTASKWEQLDVGSPNDIVSDSGSGPTLTFTKRDGSTQDVTVANDTPTLGSTVTVSTSDQDVITGIATGDVFEVLIVGSKSTLDSGQEFVDSVTIAWDLLATGTFRTYPSFAARLAGSNNGVLDGNEALIWTKNATGSKLAVRYSSTGWPNVTIKLRAYRVTA